MRISDWSSDVCSSDLSLSLIPGSTVMARLPYADLSHPEVSPLVEQIVAERGSVLHLYQMLLQSPPVARGWLNHLTGIRHNSSLPGDLREMVIIDRKSDV